jgi:hypothetical protein
MSTKLSTVFFMGCWVVRLNTGSRPLSNTLIPSCKKLDKQVANMSFQRLNSVCQRLPRKRRKISKNCYFCALISTRTDEYPGF